MRDSQTWLYNYWLRSCSAKDKCLISLSVETPPYRYIFLRWVQLLRANVFPSALRESLQHWLLLEIWEIKALFPWEHVLINSLHTPLLKYNLYSIKCLLIPMAKLRYQFYIAFHPRQTASQTLQATYWKV